MPKHKAPKYFDICFHVRDIPLIDEDYISPHELAADLEFVLKKYLAENEAGITIRQGTKVSRILKPIIRNIVATKSRRIN